MRSKQVIGDKGEKISIQYLEDNGFRVEETNYRFKHGEIDIIAREDDIWVFIEVKTRTSTKYGYGKDCVTKHKKDMIKKTAMYFLQKRYEWVNISWRFDIIEVYINNNKAFVNHIKNIVL